MGLPRHATLDVGDVDGDGDLDIVAGNFSIERDESSDWVDVWVEPAETIARRSVAPR